MYYVIVVTYMVPDHNDLEGKSEGKSASNEAV